uniref:WD_REPEATS_REGION domain-containing protein n=1 Tax=Macrostomum lignano TaxID=282301 RepID=A0A1I8FNU3_9PLAT
ASIWSPADTGLRPALWSSGLGRLVCAIGDSSDEAGRPATSADRVMSLAADAGFSLLASGSHSGRVRCTGRSPASRWPSCGSAPTTPASARCSSRQAAATPASCTAAATMPPCDCFGWPSTRPASGPCSWCPPPAGPAAAATAAGVTALACAPGLVMSASEDCTARLWDAGLRECSTVFNHHKGAVLACALAPDGSLGFTGANDASILVYDLSDKSLVHTEPQAHGDWVTSLDCFRATTAPSRSSAWSAGPTTSACGESSPTATASASCSASPGTSPLSAASAACRTASPARAQEGELKLWTYTEASAGGKVRAVAEQRSNACLLARPPTVSAAAKSSAAAAKTSAAAAKTSAAATAAAAASSKSKKSKKKLPASPSSSSEEEDSDDGGAVKVSLDDIDFGRGGCGRGGGGGDWDAQVDEDKQRGDHAEAADRPTDRRPRRGRRGLRALRRRSRA